MVRFWFSFCFRSKRSINQEIKYLQTSTSNVLGCSFSLLTRYESKKSSLQCNRIDLRKNSKVTIWLEKKAQSEPDTTLRVKNSSTKTTVVRLSCSSEAFSPTGEIVQSAVNHLCHQHLLILFLCHHCSFFCLFLSNLWDFPKSDVRTKLATNSWRNFVKWFILTVYLGRN